MTTFKDLLDGSLGRQPRNIRVVDYDEEDDWNNSRKSSNNHQAELSHLQHCRVESPLHSIQHTRARPNHSPIFSADSTYSTRMDLSDLTDVGPTNARDDIDSQKIRLYFPPNHQNNTYCSRSLLPTESPYLLQSHAPINDTDLANERASHYHCAMEEQKHRNKHIDERSTSPASSSDPAEVLTSPRQHSKHRQHLSHRHRTANLSKDPHLYHSTINSGQLNHQHSSPLADRHRQQNICHRYHEIGQPASCSPVCDSGIREDDRSSSVQSNHRDRLSSCDDINAMCSIVGTGTTTTATMSGNLLSPLPNVTVANYHHRASSGISCESSTSSPSIRNHGTLENCVTERHRNLSRHNHVIQPYALDPPQRVQSVHPRETKSPLLIGYPVLQIVRCRLGPEAPMEGTIGYPFTMAPHSHSHLPRTGYNTHLSRNQYRHPCGTDNGEGNCCKKYVVLCCLCGGLSAAVGCLFLAVHAVLSAHTASLALFETVPSYIPGIMLILMGLFTMILARRKHRYGILMKVCGSVGVVCALVCVLVTVTTTVVHMSRLQGLRECVYTARARSCTCYGAPQGRGGDPGVLFEGTPHCEAVHGALYACLRALFGVSVAGILACIFSCMLVYQLLSHEKKKMYWEQLELRSLYGHGGGGNMAGAPVGSCGCCNDCGGVNPWWAQTPGNLYTPNPDLAPSRRWRLPWSRSRGPAPTPDSNYGFHAQSMRQAADINDSTRENTTAIPNPYGLLDSRQPHASYSVLNAQNTSYTASTESYSVLETPVPLWGPPPPYSDPNSPARRPQIVEPKVASSAGSTTSSTPATGASPAQPLPPSLRIDTVKRTADNFEAVRNNYSDLHGSRTLQHCTPSDNYENTEKLSNTTEPECSGAHEGAAIKTRRSRRNLKGVENDGFQKEPNNQMSNSKQSESELYFGDVSSCCGPESSLYEMTVDKELTDEILQQQQQQQQQQQEQQQQQQQSDYMPSRMAKQRLSKRSRLPLPLLPQNQTSSHEDINLDGANERSYSNSDETMTTSGAFLAPDAQYEVIQQGAHYGYYISKENDYRDAPSSYSFYPRDPANSEIPHEYRGIVKDEDNEHSNSLSGVGSLDDDLSHDKVVSRRTEHQCCTNNVTDINSEWQNVEQQSNSDDGVCPINV
ncbi:Protein of unknown function [Cotesia congregata]|uniref:Uncharacterized protein n=1 Tax=Cotesia congregata TaxID=51543 RepID=A0A8J2HE60_COTCN|nr:Protein of unknown function [Cotesia congregata]